MIGLQEYLGYLGLFTRSEAPGAFPNGTRVRKVSFDAGDAHPIGALATVLGSVRAPSNMPADMRKSPYFYFVEWDSTPRVAIGVESPKIERAP